MRLKNKVVIVTASTRGIGLATVRACAEEGATVYITARDMEAAKAEAEKMKADGMNVKYVYNDARKTETFASMVDEVAQSEGRIDVLVNNFGISSPGKDLDFEQTDGSTFLDVVTVNLMSVFEASKAAAGYMRKNGSGSIINISSIGGIVPDISQIGYGTSKAAINYLTKLIAVHEAKNHIRCNAVLPGITATDAVKTHLPEEFREMFVKHTPLKRIGLPEEIAKAVIYFAGDESAYTTGQILTVSGGFGTATPLYGDFAGKSRWS